MHLVISAAKMAERGQNETRRAARETRPPVAGES